MVGLKCISVFSADGWIKIPQPSQKGPSKLPSSQSGLPVFLPARLIQLQVIYMFLHAVMSYGVSDASQMESNELDLTSDKPLSADLNLSKATPLRPADPLEQTLSTECKFRRFIFQLSVIYWLVEKKYIGLNYNPSC